ncbi:unnamed protein product [Prunus brigantina]
MWDMMTSKEHRDLISMFTCIIYIHLKCYRHEPVQGKGRIVTHKRA